MRDLLSWCLTKEMRYIPEIVPDIYISLQKKAASVKEVDTKMYSCSVFLGFRSRLSTFIILWFPSACLHLIGILAANPAFARDLANFFPDTVFLLVKLTRSSDMVSISFLNAELSIREACIVTLRLCAEGAGKRAAGSPKEPLVPDILRIIRRSATVR